jgi:predicted metal-dependent hydrolase
VTKEYQFKLGVDQFNSGYFFECHDTLEEIWMETVGQDRLFLQGLIQVSVGFYHLFNKNLKGAVSQFTKGLNKLDHYCPAHRGVELESFMEKVRLWKDQAERGLRGDNIVLDESLVPKIQFISS